MTGPEHYAEAERLLAVADRHTSGVTYGPEWTLTLTAAHVHATLALAAATAIGTAVNPGVTEEQVSERLAARLARQAILARDDPPAAWFLVDEAALRRCVGSPDVMDAQLAHLAGVARLPNVTIQVVLSIAHAGLLGGFAVAGRAAYVETAVAGQVFEDAEIIAGLLTRFDTLRNEAFRGSESLALIERMCEEWTASGARAATRVTTAGNA